MRLGENVKKFRLELGLTQKKLAEQVDLKRNTISDVENGKMLLSINSLKRVAKVFGCTIDELVN